jgi:hypothetical protein
MEILNGLYQNTIPHIVSEKHGGAVLKSNVYWKLCFYSDNNIVGFYGSSVNFYNPYFTKQFELKGKITAFQNNDIEFYVFNPTMNENIYFKGKIMNNGNALKIMSWKDNNPDFFWINNEYFEKIKTLDGRLKY